MDLVTKMAWGRVSRREGGKAAQPSGKRQIWDDWVIGRMGGGPGT